MAPAPPLLPPTRSAAVADFEYSVHTPPRALIRDAANVFPRVPLRDLLLVPTFQRARLDLLEFGDAQAAEKDRLLVNVRAPLPVPCLCARSPLPARAHLADTRAVSRMGRPCARCGARCGSHAVGRCDRPRERPCALRHSCELL